ncbi:MAG: gamma-glutamyltransferase [Planctomycetes bacterium]|jgi:gamma-glutamyltranspeptidase/glutathione hydrolase|nr:gamma-glutamyltransferase [Planctomycetota bacterium]
MRDLDRRTFLKALAAGSAGVLLSRWAFPRDPAAPDEPRSDHYAVGEKIAVATSSKEATEAALKALAQGGTAADAYLAAALTQTVVEPGLTTIGGALGLTYFRASTGKVESAVGRLGPAAAETYDYERSAPVSQTGRGMPVPGFLAGVKLAHEKFGSLPWAALFEAAIGHALSGVAVSDGILRAAEQRGARFPEGRALWTTDGRFLRSGEKLVQTELGRTLQAIAEGGPEAFYEGDFAHAYVKRCRTDGGRMTMEDMKGWRKTASTRSCAIEGAYRGHQVCAPRAGLLTYALHLNEALDLQATGPAKTSPESVFRQVRILEEVFLSTKTYSEGTHENFVSPAFAKKRADFVLNSPLRDVRIDDLFNTCFIVVRDGNGNCAWGTHSINTPQAFGAGIVVGGVYAAYALDRDHVRGKGATAAGISTAFALFRSGRPRLIAGSPGFGFVHGPYQVATGAIEWGLSPMEAAAAPRFGLPARMGSTEMTFENQYDASVFAMLGKRGIPHSRIPASPATGLVGSLMVDDEGRLHATQDPRAQGLAKAI